MNKKNPILEQIFNLLIRVFPKTAYLLQEINQLHMLWLISNPEAGVSITFIFSLMFKSLISL